MEHNSVDARELRKEYHYGSRVLECYVDRPRNVHALLAETVARFAQTVGLQNLVLTHFSARYQKNAGRGHSIDDLRAEASALYAGQLLLAEDVMRLHLGKNGQLTPIEPARPR